MVFIESKKIKYSFKGKSFSSNRKVATKESFTNLQRKVPKEIN